jgi:hypothetical protein
LKSERAHLRKKRGDNERKKCALALRSEEKHMEDKIRNPTHV